jgi:flagellin
MSLAIQNNIAAMTAQNNLNVSQSNMQKSLERLSSGYRINSAKDDAAGLSISQQFRANIASYKVASRNVTEANSMLQVAEGAMGTIGDILTRLKELATQSASANVSDANRTKINAEGNELIGEINRIANATKYGATSLTDGTFGVANVGTAVAGDGLQGVSGLQKSTTYNIAAVAGTNTGSKITLTSGAISQTIDDVALPAAGTTSAVRFDALGVTLTLNSSLTATSLNGKTVAGNANTSAAFQVGTTNTSTIDQISASISSVKAADLGTGIAVDKLDTQAEAQVFLVTIDSAISDLNDKRGAIGAAQNRLSYAGATLATTVENTTAAESSIRDVDMAAEMTSFTKNQILVQAGTAMLAQANSAPQQILSLFK